MVGNLGLWGAIVAVGWPAIQFMLQRRRESRERQFETYHRLIKELIVGDSTAASDSPDAAAAAVVWIDRQGAIVFELRNFRRYYPYTERMLVGLKKKWLDEGTGKPRIMEEIDLTLQYIRESWTYRLHKFMGST